MKRHFKTDIKTIRILMVKKDFDTIGKFAEASGVDRNTVSKILNGEIQPSSLAMDRIVSCLEIKPEVAGMIFFGQKLAL